MTEPQTPALEAGDEVVAEVVAPIEDQTTDEPETEEPEDGEQKDEISPAKARRERRKAEVERLHAAKEEAERENEVLRKRLKESGEDLGPAPKREDFKDYDEWQAEMAAHNVMSKMGARERAQIERQSQEREAALKALSAQEQQVLTQQWADHEAEARSRYADYDAVARNPALPITEAMVQVMGASDMGPDIAYFLGRNPGEAARIAKMQPLEMARTLGRIEAQVSLPKAPKQTQAPDPVSPVRSKATATKDPAKMSMSEYIAARKSGQIK